MKDMLLPKSKFPHILGFSALLIALCAAFFSVYGIATLFAGASISAMVMASSLEIGKLVGTTFLYRYWGKCKVYLKLYLTIAIVALMMITSLGIFGYLSAAYQKSSIEFTVTQEKIKSVQDQKPYYQDKITASKKRVDELTKLRAIQESRMSEIVTNETIARNPLQLRQLQQQNVDLVNQTDKDIRDENTKIQSTIDDIRKLDDQVNDMKLGSAAKKDVQTFKFVADALHVPLDTIARWFIISIIFVFDPLAICLILAYNVAVYKKEDETVYDDPPKLKEVEPTIVEPVVEPIYESPKVEEIPIITETKSELTPPTPAKDNSDGRDEFYKQYFK
jgi:hypothetical protein